LSADLLVGAPPRRRGAPGDAVVVAYAGRRALRSAVVWGYVFGVTVASSAYTYDRIYRTPAERERLAATFGANHAAAALFGPAPKLATVAGFTAFKVSMTLSVVGAVWGLLTGTRLLRGDEDAGRWELLVSGATTRGRAVASVVCGLGVAAAALWAITAVIAAVVGRLHAVRFSVAASLYLALALVASAVMFLAVGAVASQLAPTRRRAAGVAAAALGVSYGLRMVGDAGVGAHWLVWVSPLGWVEELRPLTDPRPLALVPVAVFTGALVLLAVALAARRDLGASTFAARTRRTPHLRLLTGPGALTLRLTGPSVLSWVVGTSLAGLLMGVVAKAAGSTITGSSVEQVFTRLGSPGTGAATFLGVGFTILGMVLAFEAGAQVAAARGEEAEGRLSHLLVAAVTRRRWLAARLGTATLAVVASGLAAGLLIRAGTAAQGGGPSLPALLAAGVNAAAPAVFLVGVGALGLGVRPRVAVAGLYVVLGWSALVELVGGFLATNRWLLDTSLFHQVAAAPAVAPVWRTDAVLCALGLLGMVAGAASFARRDLAQDA
jgi:ABC-2 type transport system permease protein